MAGIFERSHQTNQWVLFRAAHNPIAKIVSISEFSDQTMEDDDETDPEYIASADQLPSLWFFVLCSRTVVLIRCGLFRISVDKEELREVNISKKELNDLVDELFSNLSDVDFDEVNL